MRFVTYGQSNIKKAYLEEVAKAAFSVLGDKDGEIELAFVSSERMRKLNQTYRNIDKDTDVLSFLIDEETFLGQIFICYTKARKQAGEYQVSIEQEVAKLLIHGILHLYGYDHEKEDDFKKMSKKETEIIERIAIK